METVRRIRVMQDIHADNQATAEALRKRLAKSKTFLLNLMSAPGAGKTQTILRTIEELQDSLRVGVIEADIESAVDAERVAARGISVVQLNTGGFCHLDAAMVSKGLEGLDLESLDLVIIENVGNLVCPAEFDTGAIRNAMILSVPEGDDKPLKYPLMFTVCDVLLVNKVDYLELSDFDVQAMRERVLGLNPKIEIFEISAKTGQGLGNWAAWLSRQVAQFNSSRYTGLDARTALVSGRQEATMQRTVDYSKIEKQHEAMKKDIGRLRTLVTNRPEGLSADGLRKRLGGEITRLRECLRKHFRLEEQGGYLDAVIAAHRGHALTVSRLQQQHTEILADLEDAARACRRRVSLQKTTTSVLRILDVLREHEAEEHRVMQDAVLDDLGTGD